LIQFACRVTGLLIVTVNAVEFEARSPLHEENMYLEAFAVTFDGLLADTVTVALGLYHALGVVVPPFWLMESRYWVV
jgi:hypothetical protein